MARNLEATLLNFGARVSIGGSVLHKGASKKDLDIFVYPHKTSDYDQQVVMAEIVRFGVTWMNEKCKHYHDSKFVRTGEFQNKRIDFFFLQ